MLRLDHPGVVKCIKTPPGLEQGTQDLPSLCMEYCELGDLRKQLNKPESCRGLGQQQVLEILNDIVSALGYLHNRRIIHRDLKPENIVLKKTESRLVYKLIDLGYAKELGVSSLAKSFVGTLQYVAPELFLEHDYTKSVDYWSLGLLCHEIATGHRPFLPNMSPGQWVDLVASKSYQDIAIVQDVDGGIKYLQHFANNTQICAPLTIMLQEWLQLLLDWNPKTRGRDSEDNIVVFSKLNEILSRKWISVFSCSLGQTLFFDWNQHTSVQSLKEFIIAKSLADRLTPEAVLLLTEDGSELHQDKLSQLSPDDHQLFCFIVGESTINKSIDIPDLVKVALTDTQRRLQDHHQKKCSVQGYHLLSSQHQTVSLQVKSLNILSRHLRERMKRIVKESETLTPSLLRLESKYEMFKESSTLDLKRYQQQADGPDRITSNKMLTHWLRTSEDIDNNVNEVVTRVNIVIDTVEEESRSFGDHIQDTFDLHSEETELQSFVDKALTVIIQLRRDKPGLREDTTPRSIAQIVFKMLKKRDICLQKIQKYFTSLSDFMRSVSDLDMATNLILADIRQTSLSISKAQQKRSDSLI